MRNSEQQKVWTDGRHSFITIAAVSLCVYALAFGCNCQICTLLLHDADMETKATMRFPVKQPRALTIHRIMFLRHSPPLCA
jgi:hypothetical protein